MRSWNPRVIIAAALLAANAVAAQKAPGATQGAPPSQSSEVATLAGEARAALDKGDMETAVRDYGRLTALAPKVAEYQLNLGIACFSSDRPREAVEALRQALKLQPRLIQARSYLAAALAESGQCSEALPLLLKNASHIPDSHLKRTSEANGLKCAMALDQEEAALDFLRMLARDFPKDPEVLYLTVHVYSDLSTRASQRLLNTAPGSYQVHLLDAEVLEMQQKWDDAEAEYRRVLAIDPQVVGIHFRIGRLLLTKPRAPDTAEKAKQEFEEELKIDPRNSAAEYVLGELARQQRQFPDAIEHFSRAAQFDPTFVDAFIGWGKALAAIGQFKAAVAPLETAVKLQPANPVAHYQLAFAYRRAGRTEDADRELLAYRKANDNARRNLQDIRSAVTGRETPAQTAEPPE